MLKLNDPAAEANNLLSVEDRYVGPPWLSCSSWSPPEDPERGPCGSWLFDGVGSRLLASTESVLLSKSALDPQSSSIGSDLTSSHILDVGEGDALSLSVLLMPFPSISGFVFDVTLFKLFFIAEGEKSVGATWGGGWLRGSSILLLLLLLLPIMCSARERLCSESGSEEIRRSRRCAAAALRNNWLTVAPCTGEAGDVNSASSTSLSVKLCWLWWLRGVRMPRLWTCAN